MKHSGVCTFGQKIQFACSLGVCVGSLRVLQLPPPTVQKHGVRLIGNSKLHAGVKVSVNGCLSVRVSPVTDW